MTVIKIVPMPGPQGQPGSGGGVSSVEPLELDDQNGDLLLKISKTGTGTTRIETPQDDLSLRSARDITLYAGSDGPGKVYIGWGDAVYTPNSGNEVATLSDVDESIANALGNYSGLDNVKTRNWGYPTNNAVAVVPSTDGESISLKSSQASALRWHIRDNGFSYGSGENANLLPLTATVTPTEGGFWVDFTFEEQNAIPYFGNDYHYNINIPNGSDWDGLHYADAATTTTMRFFYEIEPTNFSTVDAYIGQPSVYSQFEVNGDGAWIKLANWSDGMGGTYSQSWQFTKDGEIHFPYGYSNSRTGSGDVLKFATSFDQAIIMGPNPTYANPTANRLVVAGADGTAGDGYDGEGGDVYVWAGVGGGTTGNGGDVKIDGGNGQGSGEGGYVKVRGGYSADGNGGFVEIRSGDSTSGTSGDVNITTGYSNANQGGNVAITAQSGGTMYFTADTLQMNTGVTLVGGGGIDGALRVKDSSGNDILKALGEVVLAGDGQYIGSVGPENQIVKTSQLPTGATGSFISSDNKTVTVTNGIITNIEEII